MIQEEKRIRIKKVGVGGAGAPGSLAIFPPSLFLPEIFLGVSRSQTKHIVPN